MAQRIIFKNYQSPGDYIVMTAAIRDLHRAYPGRFEVMASTLQDDVFLNNPLVKRFGGGPHVTTFPGTYSNRKSKYNIHNCGGEGPHTHFLWGYIGDLNLQLKTDVKLTELRPDLYLTPEEMSTPLIDKPYWVFASGGKRDFTAKWWDPENWQTVIDSFPGTRFVQVGGGSGGNHIHPTMRGVHDLVKRTSFRELMRLIYHSEGVLCVVTCLMHLAAAFNKPCVVVSGGREPDWWEAYTHENRVHNLREGNPGWKPPANDNFVPHKFLHTMGQLSCCKTSGCWKSKIVRVNPKDTVCSKPVQGPSALIPECLKMITPQHVIDGVNWYYDQGILGHGARSKLILPPEPPAARPKLATVLLTLNATSPQRLQTMEALRRQNINDANIKVLINGSSPATAQTCTRNGWKVLEFPTTLSYPDLVNTALGESDGFTVLVEEDRLPSSSEWIWKLKEKAGKDLVGTVRWKPCEGLAIKCLDLGLLAGSERELKMLQAGEDPELSIGLQLQAQGIPMRNIRLEEL